MRYVVKDAISFCTTGDNDEIIKRLEEKLRTMPSRHANYIENCFQTLTWHDDETYTREVRDFVVQCILDFDTTDSDEIDASDYFSNVCQAVKSLSAKRSEYPEMAKNGQLRSAYLGFLFVMLNLDDFDEPFESRAITTVFGVDAPSFEALRDEELLKVVLRHPDKWETVVQLYQSDIKHAPAIEALLDGNVMPSFGSGVL
jgi:hypothetical protein